MEATLTTQQLLRTHDSLALPAVVYSHGWWQLLPFEWDEGEGVLQCAQQLGERAVGLSFRQVDEYTVELLLQSDSVLSASESGELLARARWMLALDEDLQGFYQLCLGEPRLAHVPSERKGRILRSFSVFEDAVKCICTTNTTWAQTKGMIQRLVERLGRRSMTFDRCAFPTPQAIVSAGQAVLRDEIRLGYRAPYVYELSSRVAAGELDLEALRSSSAPAAEVRRALLQIKGIGPYAAATLLVLLGHYDEIGVDSWARKLVSKQFFGGQPVSEKQIQAVFESFGPYRALAYWFYHWDSP
jgi:3-methyladenine DNA glycosylase/8-oxoguanine DNA glycosylase